MANPEIVPTVSGADYKLTEKEEVLLDALSEAAENGGVYISFDGHGSVCLDGDWSVDRLCEALGKKQARRE